MAIALSGPPAFVVDASVSAAWFLPDEANPATEAALQATSTHDVWVPALWLLSARCKAVFSISWTNGLPRVLPALFDSTE